jgi:hypothetical protein
MRARAVLIWGVAVAATLAMVGSRGLEAGPTEPDVPPGLEPTRELAGEVIHRSTELVVPGTLEVLGDRLILGDNHADHSLRVIRRADGALERAFGRRGRGPREFEAVFSIDVLDPVGRIMVHDAALQRVTWIDLDADFEKGHWEADRSLRLQAPATILAAVATPTGLVGVGSFTDGRLAHVAADGKLIRTSGAPPAVVDEVAPAVWTNAYQARLTSRPDRTRLAVVSRFADRLEIYDRQGNLMARGHRPYGFGPEDARGDDPGNVRFAYLDVATTDARIYALFSGRTRAEGDGYLGDRILVFDWSGRLLDVWAVDSRLMAIAVAPDGGWLYGIRHHPDPAVMAYGLD